jgi:hypothetical protein
MVFEYCTCFYGEFPGSRTCGIHKFDVLKTMTRTIKLYLGTLIEYS